MKILFIADIHIKLGQKNVPREWALKRYSMFFEKMKDLMGAHDLCILGGDIFDRVPTLEELEVYFDLVSNCTIPTIVMTGNHEAETKKKSFLERLKKATNNANSAVTISTEIQTGAKHGYSECNFYLVPYEEIKKEKTWKDLESLPVFTHVRGNIEPHVKSEIPLDWLEKFPVVFAGDLHSFKNTQANIVYPGSPMTTSFHRKITKGSNGYLTIDTSDWSWSWHDFNLPQLIRKTVTSREEIVATDFHHTIYELEGSLEAVSGKVDSDLLDKKIVRRNSEATLILTEKMSLADELQEYLEWVLDIEDTSEIMEAFYEHRST
jgi:DNA repair exonuclease SbcCD nuclease subunit